MSFNRSALSFRVDAEAKSFRAEGDLLSVGSSIVGQSIAEQDSGSKRQQVTRSKEFLFTVAVFTIALQGGGLIFGSSAFNNKLLNTYRGVFTTANVSTIFAIGHNITALGCILSGFISDWFGPRKCAVSGLLIEAIGHFLMTRVNSLPHWVTYTAYGLIGIGGTQVLLAAFSFATAFKNSGWTCSVLTATFQAGGFVFMLLPLFDWVPFFSFYTMFCLLSAFLTGLTYPDSPLPVYGANVATSANTSFASTITKSMSLKNILFRPGTILFLLTFMIAGSALTYGQSVFYAAMQDKDDCQWNEALGEFTKCPKQGLQDLFNNVMFPLVGNFILPCSLVLGRLIDQRGFALPAFINIFCVQAFLLALWLFPLEAQVGTLLIYNVANTAVFTVQNAYICEVGHDHIGSLFAVSNGVLAFGNVASDWLASNPFGSADDKIRASIEASSIICIAACIPLYFWIRVEIRARARSGIGSSISIPGREP